MHYSWIFLINAISAFQVKMSGYVGCCSPKMLFLVLESPAFHDWLTFKETLDDKVAMAMVL